MWKIAVILFLGAALARDIPGKAHVIRVDGSTLQILGNGENKGSLKYILRADLDVSGFDVSQPPEDCDPGAAMSCLLWRNEKNETFSMFVEVDEECITITQEAPKNSTIADFFYYEDSQWYGGPERYQQEWPLQKMVIENDEPYVTRESNSQGVLEPYWLTSNGTVIYVKSKTLLFFNSNQREGTLGLIASNRAPYKPRNATVLKYDICDYGNPVTAHLQAIKNYLGKPTAHPGKRMMTYPTYSTWVKYKRDINQEKAIDFTNQVLENDYLLGQIEIDDKWETCYGSLTIDKSKFPDFKQLTDYIHSKGGRATAWVHPFINLGCEYYQPALQEGRLVLNEKGNALSTWWNGAGGVVDLTNQTTRDWWVQRLKTLQKESGLDGYKFDAGESSWMPQLPQINGDLDFYPDSFVRNFVEAAAEFGADLEVRVGRNTQDVPLFIRMLDKDSRWGLNNGLQSVITTALQMSLTGYPFVLPDMIGGNAYGENPSKELFIRWAQANALLPAMQFSVLPWDYDQETVDITRKYLDLHTSYTDTFLNLSNQTLIDGTPIVTPIWWYASEDPEAFPISDQYMLGANTLVAPVVTEGALQRDVYLPNGTWTDARNETFEGPTWLRNYSAPLSYLPLFTKTQ